MLKPLLKFFFADSSETSFYGMYKKLVKWGLDKVYPNDYDLPEAISLPYDFWDKIKGLYRNTSNDRLERSVSVYWVDGELILSSITTGTTSFVKSNSQIRVSYTPKNKEYYTKEVIVDGKRYSRKEVYYKKVPEKIALKYLFNMHTHPPHKQGDSVFYGFFSAQDLRSLIGSQAIVTGLITDHFYLLFRTNKVDENRVKNLEDGDISVDSVINKYNFVLFKGQLGKKLYRVLPNLGQNNNTV